MRVIHSILLYLFISVLVSCKENNKKIAIIDPHWSKLTLPNGWILFAPSNFTTKALQGVDSDPGYIYSEKDSIRLEYDSGSHEMSGDNCDLQYLFEKEKAEIDTGFYKSFYKAPSVHSAYIDTIDNRIAVIVRPKVIGKGTVGIEIVGCKNKPWLGITGSNLTKEKEKTVLEIYQTIRQVK